VLVKKLGWYFFTLRWYVSVRPKFNCQNGQDFHFVVQMGFCNRRLMHCGKRWGSLVRITSWVMVSKGRELSLCFLFKWAPCHEGVLGEWRYSSMHSLTSALAGGEWSVSCPGHFIPRERAPSTCWIGGWVGPRASLDMVVKRKITSPLQES
jgi:hypothetical protein